MTSAALVSGNTVVLKPASTTPVIAAKFVELLEEVGLPDGVVNYLPGPGSEVGDYLVDHALTRFISFTGSRDVGLRINERAARTAPGQKWIKRVIAEMGGKDSIVVDDDSDLELAADSITASALGSRDKNVPRAPVPLFIRMYMMKYYKRCWSVHSS